jgi:hypothetical protein
MFRKSTILALAAAASLGALALSTSSASALGHYGNGARTAHVGTLRVAGPVTFHRNFAFRRIGYVLPPLHHWHWHNHWRWHVWHRPYWVAPVIATSTTYATSPTWNRCNCLTKEYTQDGAVVFKDVCTNEMAMNPPAAPQGPATQQPLQQGYLQPQPAQ